MFSKKIKCFYCKEQFNNKDAFNLQVDVAEGRQEYKVCPTCAKEVNEILKELEEHLQ